MIEYSSACGQFVINIWPMIENYLQDSLEKCPLDYTVPELKDALLEQYMQLWIAVDMETSTIIGVEITSMDNYPRYNVLRLALTGGTRFAEWGEGLERYISMWARENSCKYMEGWGRAGWGKLNEKLGYKEVCRVWRKNLEE